MTQKQIDQLSIKERATQSTPLLFEKIRNMGLALTAASAVIIASPVVLPAGVVTVAGYLAVAGSVAAAISQVTVKA